jgi:hypothetical protein
MGKNAVAWLKREKKKSKQALENRRGRKDKG